jgi:hypothetical protein
MTDENGFEWSAEVYAKKGEAHLNHAETLRKKATSLRDRAMHMITVGKEGDQKFFMELEAEANERKAQELSRIGCDWVERSLELEVGG